MDRRAALGRAWAILSTVRQILGSRWARLIGAAVLVLFWAVVPLPPSSDAQNFWSIDLSDPYREPWGEANAFVYSPAVAVFLAPFTALPFFAFYKLLLAVNLGAMVWMVGWPGAALALLLPPVQAELQTGNIHLLIGAAIVLGFLRSPAWAFPILTKVTPAVGLLWFAARREWRALTSSLGVTGIFVFGTWLFVPDLWADWIALLGDSVPVVIVNYTLTQVPLFVRLPIGAGLVVLAAWRGAPWLVPIGVLLALPAIWIGSPAMLLAVFPLLGAGQLIGAPSVPPASVREGHSPAGSTDAG